MSTFRDIERIVSGVETSDGAGVKLTRILTRDLQQRLDPFLMLDAFGAENPEDYIGGFPDHPHRGFETVTYMLAGRMRHRDNAGNEGLLEPGGAQWMTAGRGLIHSETPEQEEGLMEGFQLWVNLPAKNKMIAPFYKDIPSAKIPEVTLPSGGKIRVIAGSFHETLGAIQRPDTEPLYLDVHLTAGESFTHRIPIQMNAFVYVYRGSVTIGSQIVPHKKMIVLSNSSDTLQLSTSTGAKFICVAGIPLHEPIAQHGPFVMNTQQELQQAVQDYHAGKFQGNVSSH